MATRPTIWNAVRHEVDERSGKGHFILTGSATPADDITRHSGAGRFRRILMRPMSLAESNESTRAVSLQTIIEKQPFSAFGGGPTVEAYAHIIVRGGWPALVTDPTAEASEYLDSYLDDMTRVDLAATVQRVDPARMNALVRALARNVSFEVTLQKLAAEADVIAPGQGHPGSWHHTTISGCPRTDLRRRRTARMVHTFTVESSNASTTKVAYH